MLDPSEIDRLVEIAGVPLTQLVDWKNRLGEPFRLRCEPNPDAPGLYRCTIDLPVPIGVKGAVPVVHGEFEKREEDGGAITYEARPGNTMGQLAGPDGRPAFAVGYDLTALDPEGRPLLKVYFGTAAAWFVKNEYHPKWNSVRDVRKELEPQKFREPARDDDRTGKERGQAPERHFGGGRGPGPAEGRGGGDGGGGGDGRRRRGRRGGRGRGRGGQQTQ